MDNIIIILIALDVNRLHLSKRQQRLAFADYQTISDMYLLANYAVLYTIF